MLVNGEIPGDWSVQESFHKEVSDRRLTNCSLHFHQGPSGLYGRSRTTADNDRVFRVATDETV